MSDALRQPASEDDDREAIDGLVDLARTGISSDVQAALRDATRAAELAGAVGYAPGHSRALRIAGDCLSRLARPAEARRALEESIALAQVAGDARGEADARCVLGGIEYLAARYEPALEQFLRSLELSRASYDRLTESNALNGCATTHYALGDYPRAAEEYLASLTIKRAIGDRATEAGTLSNLGLLHQELGNYAAAAKLHREALQIKRDLGDRTGEANALANLGLCLQHLGLADEAHPLQDRALQIARVTGNRHTEAACLENLGLITAALGEPEAALGLFDHAVELQRELGNELGETSGLVEQGRTLIVLGRHDEAFAVLEHALSVAERLRTRKYVIEARRALADACEAAGDKAGALRHLRIATDADDQLLHDEVARSTAGLLAGFEVERALQEIEIERRRREDLEAANAALRTANDEKERLLERLRAQQLDLERTARADPLTGLLNRRAMEHELDRRFREARRYGRELTLALVDIDHFKLVNDVARSHRTGDDVLKAVATLMTEHAREVDFVARWGGEEFALCFPTTTRERAFTACERLRVAIESHDWSSFHPEVRVTISTGLAGSGEAETVDELVFLADERLYEAKEDGRNQVCW